jgi:hypothetical protein
MVPLVLLAVLIRAFRLVCRQFFWGGRFVLVTRFFDMWSYRGVVGPSDRMFCIQVPVKFYFLKFTCTVIEVKRLLCGFNSVIAVVTRHLSISLFLAEGGFRLVAFFSSSQRCSGGCTTLR